MKGIYLTEEGKKEIEAKIAELENVVEKYQKCKNWMWFDTIGQLEAYKEILSSATILPVEESWQETMRKLLETFQVEDKDSTLEGNYPNGVIIKSKQ
jgi:hypothetical protein